MKPTLPAVSSLVLAVAVAASAGPAVAGTPSAPASSAQPHFALPFIQNDYPKALAEARARKVPLFIEAWAPW